MRNTMLAFGLIALLPTAALAQGTVRGAEDGIDRGGAAAGPVGAVVGGAVGANARAARPIGYRAAAEDVPQAIERLLKGYNEHRFEGENLRGYFNRSSDEDLRNLIAGAVVAPVERDPGPARHPPNIDM